MNCIYGMIHAWRLQSSTNGRRRSRPKSKL
jgi:hypothetical protein